MKKRSKRSIYLCLNEIMRSEHLQDLTECGRKSMMSCLRNRDAPPDLHLYEQRCNLDDTTGT